MKQHTHATLPAHVDWQIDPSDIAFLGIGQWLLSPKGLPEQVRSLREEEVSDARSRKKVKTTYFINELPAAEWQKIPLTLDFLEAQGFRMEENEERITYYLPGMLGSTDVGNAIELCCFKKFPETFPVTIGDIYMRQESGKWVHYWPVETIDDLQDAYLDYVREPLTLKL